ncbi:MAG UNVERIFIED_CONTAM: hypothetical protein LVR29_25190 [Microcystis novacekii LVE1205-3]
MLPVSWSRTMWMRHYCYPIEMVMLTTGPEAHIGQILDVPIPRGIVWK